MADEEKKPQEQTPDAAQAKPGQVRLLLEGVVPEYANFCTITARQGEVFLSFGKAFAPSAELKIDNQIVMSLRNVEQLHEAMGRLLEQVKTAGAR